MKQVERFDVSPIEQELAFNRWCKQREIEMILMDGDDTLWKTRSIFIKQQERCYDFLAQQGILSREEWRLAIEKENDKLFETTGVNPMRWDMVIDSISKYGLTTTATDQAKSILRQIYNTPSEFIKDTEKGLEFLSRVEIQKGIVTHANRGWTVRKYNWLNLERYFSWDDDIFIVNEDGHKTAQSWREAMEYFRVRPENCMVIGDSPRSDINPAIEIGVGTCMLVQNGSGIWSVHQHQIINEDIVWTISSLDDVRHLGGEVVYSEKLN